MQISTNLLKAIAASVMLGGAMTSCVQEKELITPDTACETDCKLDHNHKESSSDNNHHLGNCPACGMG